MDGNKEGSNRCTTPCRIPKGESDRNSVRWPRLSWSPLDGKQHRYRPISKGSWGPQVLNPPVVLYNPRVRCSWGAVSPSMPLGNGVQKTGGGRILSKSKRRKLNKLRKRALKNRQLLLQSMGDSDQTVKAISVSSSASVRSDFLHDTSSIASTDRWSRSPSPMNSPDEAIGLVHTRSRSLSPPCRPTTVNLLTNKKSKSSPPALSSFASMVNGGKNYLERRSRSVLDIFLESLPDHSSKVLPWDDMQTLRKEESSRDPESMLPSSKKIRLDRTPMGMDILSYEHCPESVSKSGVRNAEACVDITSKSKLRNSESIDEKSSSFCFGFSENTIKHISDRTDNKPVISEYSLLEKETLPVSADTTKDEDPSIYEESHITDDSTHFPHTVLRTISKTEEQKVTSAEVLPATKRLERKADPSERGSILLKKTQLDKRPLTLDIPLEQSRKSENKTDSDSVICNSNPLSRILAECSDDDTKDVHSADKDERYLEAMECEDGVSCASESKPLNDSSQTISLLDEELKITSDSAQSSLGTPYDFSKTEEQKDLPRPQLSSPQSSFNKLLLNSLQDLSSDSLPTPSVADCARSWDFPPESFPSISPLPLPFITPLGSFSDSQAGMEEPPPDCTNNSVLPSNDSTAILNKDIDMSDREQPQLSLREESSKNTNSSDSDVHFAQEERQLSSHNRSDACVPTDENSLWTLSVLGNKFQSVDEKSRKVSMLSSDVVSDNDEHGSQQHSKSQLSNDYSTISISNASEMPLSTPVSENVSVTSTSESISRYVSPNVSEASRNCSNNVYETSIVNKVSNNCQVESDCLSKLDKNLPTTCSLEKNMTGPQLSNTASTGLLDGYLALHTIHSEQKANTNRIVEPMVTENDSFKLSNKDDHSFSSLINEKMSVDSVGASSINVDTSNTEKSHSLVMLKESGSPVSLQERESPEDDERPNDNHHLSSGGLIFGSTPGAEVEEESLQNHLPLARDNVSIDSSTRTSLGSCRSYSSSDNDDVYDNSLESDLHPIDLKARRLSSSSESESRSQSPIAQNDTHESSTSVSGNVSASYYVLSEQSSPSESRSSSPIEILDDYEMISDDEIRDPTSDNEQDEILARSNQVNKSPLASREPLIDTMVAQGSLLSVNSVSEIVPERFLAESDVSSGNMISTGEGTALQLSTPGLDEMGDNRSLEVNHFSKDEKENESSKNRSDEIDYEITMGKNENESMDRIVGDSFKGDIEENSSKEEIESSSFNNDIEGDISKDEIENDFSKNEIEGDSSEDEPEGDSFKNEIEGDSSKAETEGDSFQNEIEGDTSKDEIDSDCSTYEIEDEHSNDGNNSDSSKDETESDSSIKEIDGESSDDEIDRDYSKDGNEGLPPQNKTKVESDSSSVTKSIDSSQECFHAKEDYTDTQTDNSSTLCVNNNPLADDRRHIEQENTLADSKVTPDVEAEMDNSDDDEDYENRSMTDDTEPKEHEISIPRELYSPTPAVDTSLDDTVTSFDSNPPSPSTYESESDMSVDFYESYSNNNESRDMNCATSNTEFDSDVVNNRGIKRRRSPSPQPGIFPGELHTTPNNEIRSRICSLGGRLALNKQTCKLFAAQDSDAQVIEKENRVRQPKKRSTDVLLELQECSSQGGIFSPKLYHQTRRQRTIITRASIKKLKKRTRNHDLSYIAQKRVELIKAVEDGNLLKVQELVQDLGPAVQEASTGSTLLHVAAVHKQIDTLLFLLRRINPNVVNNDGQTPLHLAAMMGHTQILRILMKDEEVCHQKKDRQGRTYTDLLSGPLCDSVLSKDYRKVQELLKLGADPDYDAEAVVKEKLPSELLVSTPRKLASDLELENLSKLFPQKKIEIESKKAMAPDFIFFPSRSSINSAGTSRKQFPDPVEMEVTPAKTVVEGRGIYPVDTEPRGFVCILDYSSFQNRQDLDLEGSPQDISNLVNVFGKMGYAGEVYSSPSAEETREILMKVRNSDVLKETGCLITIVNSHTVGNDQILTSDLKVMNASKLFELFKDSDCPHMTNKPKIFIFNTCSGLYRGSKRSRYSKSQDTRVSEPMKDSLCLFSTNQGISPYTYSDKGTPFISTLCDTLAKHAHDTEISDLFREFLKEFGKFSPDAAPELRNIRFYNKFFFNPVP